VTKERRLGRGLEALLGRAPDAPAPTIENLHLLPEEEKTPVLARTLVRIMDRANEGETVPIPVGLIDPNPFQPRVEFPPDELKLLVESLKSNGLLQPVVVRRVDQRYQLIAGERRWRAAQEAGWNEIHAKVVPANDQQMAELALVENLHRADLNAMEKAYSFSHYLEKFGGTQEELAHRVNIDRTTVSNLLRLLELPTLVQASVRTGKISTGHAKALLPLETAEQQDALCRRVTSEGLSVRALEGLVQQTLAAEDGEPAAGASAKPGMPVTRGKRPAQVLALELELRQSLGTKVDLRVGSRQRGKIVIHFSNQEEFERLREQLSTPSKGKRQQAS
jgi:ParB family chromosome partitioning protein